ncbi:Asp-tRNA(Asn)/Glu-tRNA(Gln) amidotransferase subunit GatB [Candidatus Pacearchaeota archaeon]|nr:Asp-tRNA(Asn)/Glu-tRNA(Gln) amidotransferase subunit GatB [Candidatus Pacearchaeota archaeon]
MMKNEGMIGLEIHTYLLTREKLFCPCIASRKKGLKPNTYICPICTGQPGAKPMLPNKKAVEKAVQIGLMLGCKIHDNMVWQRKHYDWPDLPKGYQNTLSGGSTFPVGSKGKFYGINISSMHLEEDPASWDPDKGEIDYNRSGLPLVEIVTSPDFTASEEVVDWLKRLTHALSYLKAADSDAGIKVDVNVSIRGKTQRVEVKNINSLEGVQKAIEYELERQEKEGGIRETRRFDEKKGKTMKMREKESQDDYRFISDPDLMPLVLDGKFVEILRKSLPESPEKKLEKLIKKYHVDEKNASILTKHIDVAEFFEKVAEKIDPLFALPWVTVELLRFLNYRSKKLDEVDISVEHFVALLSLVKQGKITPLKAKDILNQFYPKSFMPKEIEGKISDIKELEKFAKEAIAHNSKAASDYKSGDKNAINFLMGAIMKMTNKRADFAKTKEILIRLLK